MFDAIEDMPTEALITELKSRGVGIIRPSKTPMRYLVWSDNDPNDSFEVDARSADEAAWGALDELGWCVSAEPYNLDEPEEEMVRFRVFGFSDAEGSQHTESLLEAYKTADAAIRAATDNPMATQVIDWETNEVLWEWDKDSTMR
jgi:hypothetical protein